MGKGQLVGIVAGGVLVAGLLLALGYFASPYLPKRPHAAQKAFEASAKKLGLDFAEGLILTGSIDGVTVDVRRSHRDRNAGQGFETRVLVKLGVPEDLGLDTKFDASAIGLLKRSTTEPLTFDDPAFDDTVSVWGNAAAARNLLLPDVRAAIVEAEKDTRILIVKGDLLGEYGGLVKKERTLTKMILATVEVAKTIRKRRNLE
jgi:hypothetical protein